MILLDFNTNCMNVTFIQDEVLFVFCNFDLIVSVIFGHTPNVSLHAKIVQLGNRFIVRNIKEI